MSVEWAAGLFEGEGCIWLAGGTYPRIKLLMTDRDVVERFADVVGGTCRERSHHRHDAPSHLKPIYGVEMTGAEAKRVLRMFLPYLGERRGAKAREAMAYAPAPWARQEDA